MTVSLAGPSRWTPRRWWCALGLVSAAQVAIIFWLGETKVAPPRTPSPAPPTLHLAKQGADESLTLTDPTLFALPHREGFSGTAWLVAPTQDFRPFAWAEPPRWLGLSTEKLGAVFNDYVKAAEARLPLTPVESEPELLMPRIPTATEFANQSTYRLTGELVQRQLLTPVELPSWPSSEILTNSRVQMLVDADGKPVSVTLLYPGSGSKDADTNALWQAANARFASNVSGNPTSSNQPVSNLSWGQMVFEWHTLPKPPTNTISQGKP